MKNGKNDTRIATSGEKSGKNTKKILIIVVSALLAAVVIFLAVFLTVSAVRDSLSVVRYSGVRIGEGEAKYFASYYKYRYIVSLRSSGIDAYDTEEFWERKSEGGESYGALLSAGALDFMKELCARASLFESQSSLTADDKEAINKNVQDVLDYRADGSRDKFNEMAAEYGFDYGDLVNCAALMYKAAKVKSRLFGEGGAAMYALPDACSGFLANYSHVRLLIIRTEDKFLLDENGNRIKDEDGNDATAALTDYEKAERQARISEIRTLIDAYRNDGEMKMSEVSFKNYIEKWGEGDSKVTDGYYFLDGSSYTKEFSETLPDIVTASLEMKVGEYCEVALPFGVCFIYRAEPAAAAYTNQDAGWCFEDFYTLAADYTLSKMVSELTPDVVVTERIKNIDFVKIPYNYELVVRY